MIKYQIFAPYNNNYRQAALKESCNRLSLWKNGISANSISVYRTELMGIATIMILLCHSVHYIEYPSLIALVLSLCNYGVEIFLFLSGIGLYFSLAKRESHNQPIGQWYKHRYLRIGVPYVLFWVMSYFMNYEGMSLSESLLSFTTVGYWINHKAAWFIALLLPLYAISPLLYRLQGRTYGVIGIIGILIALCAYRLVDIVPNNYSVAYNAQFAIYRSTSFILGMLIGERIYKKQAIQLLAIMATFSAFVLACLSTGILYHWIWMLCLLVCLILVCMISKLPDLFHWILKFMGRISAHAQ